MALLPWLVCSPKYGEIVPVLDYGQGPMEYGCDVVFVEAETRRDALLLGVALFRQQGARYLADAENPYAGVKVESQVCSVHGTTQIEWKGDHFDCEGCAGMLGEFETEDEF
jgi:hypothetical protein